MGRFTNQIKRMSVNANAVATATSLPLLPCSNWKHLNLNSELWEIHLCDMARKKPIGKCHLRIEWGYDRMNLKQSESKGTRKWVRDDVYIEQRENAMLCWMQLLISFHLSESNFDSKTHKYARSNGMCNCNRKLFSAIGKIVFPLLHSVFLHRNGVNYIISQCLWIRRCYFRSLTPISQSFPPAIGCLHVPSDAHPYQLISSLEYSTYLSFVEC